MEHDPGTSLQWICRPFPDLKQRTWEGEAFVFNPLTGHTHILNTLAWQLLTICATIPRSEQFLLQALAEKSPDTDFDQLGITLTDHLEQLRQLDLLQPDYNPCN